MDRRTFIAAAAGTLAASLPLAEAQSTRPAVIGFLGLTSAASFSNRVSAFRSGLRELGYVEGRDYVIEFRWAEGHDDRLHDLATELVQLNVRIVVTHATAGALAAKRATTSIPIVMAVGGDAVITGLANSLARPGGNVTGSTILIPDLNVKRLELLKEVAPRLSRVAVLVHRGSPANAPMLSLTEMTGKSLDLTLRHFEVEGPEAFQRAFQEMDKARVDGVLVFEEPMLLFNARTIADLAMLHRLPLAGFLELGEAGGVIGFGVDIPEMFHRAAFFVDRILKGAKAGDIPIEQATRFRLILNLKSAATLGLTIPQSLTLRADQVID
jgi:putative ABC transport system substrate-binding protein